MRPLYTTNGKQILLAGVHFGDGRDEAAAQLIVKALNGELAKARVLTDTLQFYADPDSDGYTVYVTNYGLSTDVGDIIDDGGKRARAALALARGDES